MVYQVEITAYAEKRVGEIFDYLMYYVGGYGNPGAASRFANDYGDALQRLANSAHAYVLCEDAELASMGERKIHFRKLDYKLFFHIDNDTVIIDLICHDSQDYLAQFHLQ